MASTYRNQGVPFIRQTNCYFPVKKEADPSPVMTELALKVMRNYYQRKKPGPVTRIDWQKVEEKMGLRSA